MLHVVLVEPEIAGNAGSVARTCLAAGAQLHLVRPLGFHLDDAKLRRAGMDYWREAEVKVHASFAALELALAPAFAAQRVFSLTTRGQTTYSSVGFEAGDVLLFGPESRGLPELVRERTKQLRIPMRPHSRSLNLAVSVGVVLYEVWRQLGFEGGG